MNVLSEYERYKPLLDRIEKRGDAIERIAVVNEALSWMGTPFDFGQRVKGAGIDCGQFLIAVYSTIGLMPDYEPTKYAAQWHLHEFRERYMEDILKFAHPVDGPPETGEVAMFHLGHVYAHAAIVIDWPERVIHAPGPHGRHTSTRVQLGDASRDALLLWGGAKFPPKFFSPWGSPSHS